jgi:hypothetical protein
MIDVTAGGEIADDARARSNVLRLAAAQALTGANSAVIFATGSIVGATLAPDVSLATVPISMYVVGLAAGTLPTGAISRAYGRRVAFIMGTYPPVPSRAFSSEVDSGSRKENASKQEARAPFRFDRNGKSSSHNHFLLGGRMPSRSRLDEFIAVVESGDHAGAIERYYTEDASMQENAARRASAAMSSSLMSGPRSIGCRRSIPRRCRRWSKATASPSTGISSSRKNPARCAASTKSPVRNGAATGFFASGSSMTRPKSVLDDNC